MQFYSKPENVVNTSVLHLFIQDAFLLLKVILVKSDIGPHMYLQEDLYIFVLFCPFILDFFYLKIKL